MSARNARVSAYDRDPHNFYVEPAWAVRALLEVERPFNFDVMDPCAGSGTIPHTLRAAGVYAYGCDLIERGFGNTLLSVGCLRETIRNWRPCNIVSNPPYDRWEEVVEIGFDAGADRTCLILPIRYVEGIERAKWYRRYTPARKWNFSQRVDMPPHGKPVVARDGKKKRGNKQYAWFVWERGWTESHYQGGWLPIMDTAP